MQCIEGKLGKKLGKKTLVGIALKEAFFWFFLVRKNLPFRLAIFSVRSVLGYGKVKTSLAKNHSPSGPNCAIN